MQKNNLYRSELYPAYRFSKDGSIYSYQGNEWKRLKPIQRSKDKKYVCVTIKDRNGEYKQKAIHRIIAEVFIPNPHNYPIINHKDENPANNSVENLEWCTYKYNNHYGTAPKKSHAGLVKTWKVHSIPIAAVDKRNNKLTFDSGADAARFFGCGKSTIWRHVKKRQIYKGYILMELSERKENYG